MLYKSEQRLLKVYTYKRTYTTRHTHMGNVNRAVSSFPIFPGSAAGAAALKYIYIYIMNYIYIYWLCTVIAFFDSMVPSGKQT